MSAPSALAADGDGEHNSVDLLAGAVSGVVTLAQAEGTIWVAEHTPPGMSLMT
jgi:hypothetical protein